MKYIDVILPLPLEGLFTYSVPDTLAESVGFGFRVLVPLGKSKTYVAVTVRVHDEKPDFQVRDILAVLDHAPVVLERQYRLWQWVAEYYMAAVGDVYKAAMPAGLKAEEGYKPKTETYVQLAPAYRSEQALHRLLDDLRRAHKQQAMIIDFLALSHWDTLSGDMPQEAVVEVARDELLNASHGTAAMLKALTDRGVLQCYEREVGRLNTTGTYSPDKIKRLNANQQEAYNAILFQMLRKNVVLLHGVTSSGKTEIYIHLIQKMLDEKRQVLYLLPEIALTVQMMDRLRSVFGPRLGIYHSKYSDAERVEIWQKQLSHNPYDIILGARSAVFLPFQRLGLVIIDEEHETSFKQQDPAPRYHARSAAIMLAAMYGAKTLLGTATPSMESYYNATTGKYGLVQLFTRYQDIQMPEITVVDIKDLQRRKMMTGPYSPVLLAAMRRAFEAGEQVIIFQNRRGFVPMIECKMCGWVPKCQNCDVALTYHKNMNVLSCHYCGYTYRVPEQCPCCESKNVHGVGLGTEKVEDTLMQIFPEARVARMDLDTTRSRAAYERIISDFSAGRTNLLIGTQMVTKGLDFDRVSVVGILYADSMLNMPDFRAYEHAFMMMAQVSGRAGRKGKRGQVYLQTKNPQLPLIRQVVDNDYEGFFRAMCEERRAFNYPPFTRLVYIYLKHRDNPVVESAATYMASVLRQWFGTRVLGPDKPAVARVKMQHIRKMVLKLEQGIDLRAVRQYLRQAQRQLAADTRFAAVTVYFDVDPL